jgi:hypothetical protein
MVGPTQIALVLAEFERLLNLRDLAAYAVTGCLEQAIYCCQQGDTGRVLDILVRAKTRYEQADSDLQDFKQRNPEYFAKESHGNRTITS